MDYRLTISAWDEVDPTVFSKIGKELLAVKAKALTNWLLPMKFDEDGDLIDDVDYAEMDCRVNKFSYRYRTSNAFRTYNAATISYLVNQQELLGWDTFGNQQIALFLLFFRMELNPCSWNSRTMAHFNRICCDLPTELEGFQEFFQDEYMHYCDYHGEYTLNDVSEVSGYDYVCDDCLNDDFTYSDYEGEYLHNDSCRTALDRYGNEVTIHQENESFSYNDELDCYVHDEYEEHAGYIADYHSSKRRIEFVDSDWTRINSRYLGVELEVEVKDYGSRSEKAKQIGEWQEANLTHRGFFFERDGSLNNGFELVSNPMGLDKHRDTWSWLRDSDLVKGLRSHNTDTCGLHVHVNRKSVTKATIDKAVFFLNRPLNETLIRTVARRYGAGYCKQKSKHLGAGYKNKERDRYEMLNLCNTETIEFRIFRGTLKYESVMACIEFAHAVLEFCAVSSNQSLNYTEFVQFLCKPSMMADTKYLRSYLAGRNAEFNRIITLLGNVNPKRLETEPDSVEDDLAIAA